MEHLRTKKGFEISWKSREKPNKCSEKDDVMEQGFCTNGQSLVHFVLAIRSIYGIFSIFTYSLHSPSTINTNQPFIVGKPYQSHGIAIAYLEIHQDKWHFPKSSLPLRPWRVWKLEETILQECFLQKHRATKKTPGLMKTDTMKS